MSDDYVPFDEQFAQERERGRAEVPAQTRTVTRERVVRAPTPPGGVSNKVQARKMVLVSVLLLVVIQVYKDKKSETPQGTYRRIWAVGVVAIFLSILADFAPQIAGPFAALAVLGSLTNGGEQALQKILGSITPQTGDTTAGGTAPASVASTRTGPTTQTTTVTKGAATTVAHQAGP